MENKNIPETLDNYYILNDDNSKSEAYTLDELAMLKTNEVITKDTLVIKDNEAPKPAGTFIDFYNPDITDNSGTKNDKELPQELNTLNFGAFMLAPFWGYSHFPKYRVFWGCLIAFVCLLYIFLIFNNLYLFPKMVALSDDSNMKKISDILNLLNLLKSSRMPLFLISIIFLVQGNRLAWRNKEFESIDQFKNIQKKWLIWGFVIFLSLFIISFFKPILQIIYIL